MGGITATRPLDISHYVPLINRGDALFNGLWGRGCYSSKNWIPHTENKFLHLEQQWWAIGKELGLNWRTKRKCLGPIGLLSTQAQVRVWCQRKAKATSSWRLGLKKGFEYCKEPSMGKIGAQLGRAISYHISGWNMCVLSWRPRGKGCTTPLECK